MILSGVFLFHWGPSWLSPFRPYLGFAKKGSLTLRIALLSTTVLGFCLWGPLSRHPPKLWYDLVVSGTIWYCLVRFGTFWYELVLSGTISYKGGPPCRKPRATNGLRAARSLGPSFPARRGGKVSNQQKNKQPLITIWAPVAATEQLGPKSLNRNVGLLLNK